MKILVGKIFEESVEAKVMHIAFERAIMFKKWIRLEERGC